jgi:hypothetical protein
MVKPAHIDGFPTLDEVLVCLISLKGVLRVVLRLRADQSDTSTPV